ncbi:hypothetical protein F300043A5_16400 [Massilimicrobiota timonensis]|uniref:Uncharacterized protein n=1 Tax=Massilimicrobiota timonensis TaxID=1776392 RepID=A0A1Y4T050_9FIRM|nr:MULTISPECIES: hypothetical protein [Bacillota]OUQ34571.1 hypothetical protein B5E75_06230 [Massilimicrobiota timonensis]QUN13313.1 hypothetical protein KEC48_01945 [Clostridium sp. C1]
MEKQTRINKYKELRDEMKEEVAIDRQVTYEQDDEDDDFLSFLPQNHQKDIQDTLMEPLSYETLKPDSEDIKSALNEAKTNMGKEQYNTRLDILNKIKQSEEHQPQHSEASQSEVKAEPQKKMSLLEKLAAMSPEEDAEELKKYEEGLTVADFMKEDKKKSKREKVEKTEKREKHQEPVENIKEDSDDEDQEDSKLVTILNYVIIVFIVIFIVLAFFIAKQLFF